MELSASKTMSGVGDASEDAPVAAGVFFGATSNTVEATGVTGSQVDLSASKTMSGVGGDSEDAHVAAGVSFGATSNKVEATKVSGSRVDLRCAIMQNAAFSRAFESLGSDTAGRTGQGKNRESGAKPSASIIQSSEASAHVIPTRHGLVTAVLDAYNRHHNLILRPDDVWQAILTQFSFYVNANAEELRDCFVDFDGKKTLVVEMAGTLFSASFATFANRMVDEQICRNLKSADVTTWLLPKFSTTTSADRVAASVTVMSTLQAYFEYVCCLLCGIPNVTLEGTPEDWEALRSKIDRLPSYDISGKDPVMSKWHKLLCPVLDKFMAAAKGNHDLAFWDRICSHEGGGSGPSYVSGWITVFACFTAKGNWQGDVHDPPFRRRSLRGSNADEHAKGSWPFIDTSYLPVGAVSVPVLVDDNGTQYDTQMLAGQFAYDIVGDGQDTVRPRNDWCIAYEGSPKADPRDYKAGEIRPTLVPSRAEDEAAAEKAELAPVLAGAQTAAAIAAAPRPAGFE